MLGGAPTGMGNYVEGANPPVGSGMKGKLAGCQKGMTLVEVIISLALFALVGIGFVSALSEGIRGTSLVDERSTAVNLARAQLESVKSQAYAEPVAYATVTPANTAYSLSITGTVLTPGYLQQVTATVSYPRGSFQLSGYKVNHQAPIYADVPVPEPPPAAPPGTEQVTYYLHNYPTPPVGNTNAQANLPLDTTAPAAYVLYNYDQDRDAKAGLLIAKSDAGAGEADLKKYQNWRMGAALTGNFHITGTVEVRTWSAMKDFALSKAGGVSVFLRDWNGTAYTEIASGTLFQSDWQAGWNTFVEDIIQIPSVDYTLLAGHYLEVKIVVGLNSNVNMWFAYDTDDFPSRVFVPKEVTP